MTGADPSSPPLSVVSLFAGIGGFDLGFDRAGFRIVAHVEKDPHCRALLAAKWPDAQAFDDVCTVGARNLPPCEVVIGGSPCQGFSVAGLRKGMNDDRSTLATEFVRICDELRPTYVVWENVPGVLSMPDNAFGNFVAALVGADEPFVSPHGGKWKGAGVAVGPQRAVAWRVLDAQWFGVAQRRRRVFLVGVAHGRFRHLPGVDAAAERACEILFEPEGVRRDCPPRRETGKVAPRRAASGVGAGRTGNERTEVDFLIEEPQAFTAGSFGGYKPGAGTLRANGGDLGGGSETLIASGGVAEAMAFSCKDHAADAGDVSPTLRSMGHDESHANGGGQVAVAFKPSHFTRGKDGAPAEVVAPLSADADKGDQESVVAVGNKVSGCWWDGGQVSQTLDAVLAKGQTMPEKNRFPAVLVNPDGWKPVSFAADCGQDPETGELGDVCSVCGESYVDCDCPGPTQEGMEYRVIEGILHARPIDATAMRIRRLTPTECERLQGFPDGWTEGFSDSTRYKMLGNAVCVNVSRWLASRIAKFTP